MEQLTEITGAVLVLLAFVLAQLGRLATTSLSYLLLNLLGAGSLAIVAAIDGDAGFLLLEGVWATVSAYAIAVRLRRGPSPRS